MNTETLTLEDIQKDLSLLLQKVSRIETSLEEIDNDLHKVKPSYIKKLEKIKKGKFHSFNTKEDFLRSL